MNSDKVPWLFYFSTHETVLFVRGYRNFYSILGVSAITNECHVENGIKVGNNNEIKVGNLFSV